MPLSIPSFPADFWRLWLIGAILFMGRWIDMLAMAVYVYQHTRSAFLVSLLMVLRFLPMSLFGLFAGAIADRVERRTLLIVVNAGMLASSVVLVVLEVAGLLAVWHLMLASFIGGIATTFDNPVRRLMIGDVVGTQRMGSAMAFDVATSNGTRTFGPFLAGALLATAGILSVFVLDAALYAIAFGTAFFVHARNHRAGEAQEPMLARLREGWAICRASPRLMGTLLLTIYFNIFVYPYVSIVPVVGADILHLNEAEIGMLASMDGLGSLIGALLIGLWIGQASFTRLYAVSVVSGHIVIMLFVLTGGGWSAGLVLTITGVVVSGFSVTQNTLVYLLAPSHARSRMMGLLTVSIGVGPLGFLILGTLAEALGPVTATLIMGSAGLITLLATRRHWTMLLSRARY